MRIRGRPGPGADRRCASETKRFTKNWSWPWPGCVFDTLW